MISSGVVITSVVLLIYWGMWLPAILEAPADKARDRAGFAVGLQFIVTLGLMLGAMVSYFVS